MASAAVLCTGPADSAHEASRIGALRRTATKANFEILCCRPTERIDLPGVVPDRCGSETRSTICLLSSDAKGIWATRKWGGTAHQLQIPGARWWSARSSTEKVCYYSGGAGTLYRAGQAAHVVECDGGRGEDDVRVEPGEWWTRILRGTLGLTGLIPQASTFARMLVRTKKFRRSTGPDLAATRRGRGDRWRASKCWADSVLYHNVIRLLQCGMTLIAICPANAGGTIRTAAAYNLGTRPSLPVRLVLSLHGR